MHFVILSSKGFVQAFLITQGDRMKLIKLSSIDRKARYSLYSCKSKSFYVNFIKYKLNVVSSSNVKFNDMNNNGWAKKIRYNYFLRKWEVWDTTVSKHIYIYLSDTLFQAHKRLSDLLLLLESFCTTTLNVFP